MYQKILFAYFITLLILAKAATAQTCTAIGQNPSTAFPVCGTKTFQQQSVPICGIRNIPGPQCNTPGNGPHMDKNPFWYKFTCYTAGTLGFAITPIVLNDDYDWQLFDVTGHQPDDVYTDMSLYVSMNWSGESGITGASSAGTSLDVCGGYNQPLFSSMATLQQGHNYLLLISHFTDSQIGYQLTFGGGTANITDPTMAQLKDAGYYCGPVTAGIKLSKRLKCNSLAADGSDFAFSPAGPKILSAKGVDCSSGFDMDSLVLQLDKPLAPGNYTLVSQTGTDGNTLLDACGNALTVGQRISFTVVPPPPAIMGAVNTLPCAPDQIQLTFPQPIRCSTIAPGGGDFILSGPSPIRITGATGNCDANGLTQTVTLQLDQRILQDGDYKITLVNGPDGNTLESECHVLIPSGGVAGFHIPPQPFVPLGNIIPLPCAPDQIQLQFDQPVRCSSVSGDGSDFIINGPSPVVVTSSTTTCDVDGFTKTIILQLKKRILLPGNYQVQLVSGSDGNTLQSICWQQTPAGSAQPFVIAPQPAVLLLDAAPAVCNPVSIKVGLSTPVRCTSIAPDGSDFTVTGPTAVHIAGATGICNSNNLADSIELKLSNVIQTAGDYVVQLTTGTDGNTLQSECWQEAVAGQHLNFRTADTVSAAFNYTLQQQCRITTVNLTHDGKHAVNAWKWSFDDGDQYTIQNPSKVYTSLGNKQVTLTVSNGVCSDTQDKTFLLRSEVSALFDVDPGPYCPLDVVILQNKSLGNIQTWKWEYGNGASSTGPTPIQMQYFPSQKEEIYHIRLIVENGVHCQDTTDHYIKAVTSCYIDVPTAFSPNNDGQNDYLYPLNAYKALDLNFSVYNRFGQLIFETTDWTRKWDGTVGGKPADIGTYVWMLHYTEKDSGKKIFRKGTTVLIR
ncbi:gliding motility-associated-like protein [Chitinophaga niastensis]|uniref:Gliding motility-associated-like protein n=1 Tax=Chitinophaga niastensis TaxID=536980 RepID=A0A2P8HF71_CHINA|nr:PKD domain-containing protein [Chitinophaga niastensis]PSL44870.1 gliding motility-associated-like protein [Chitinophaga niastensis]